MNDTDAATRPHLSIGEVLALLQDEFPDITISKIRFLESQGLLDPERTPSGYRKFYDDDIVRLRWILAQQRDHFLPLKVIKERLAAVTSAAELDDSGAAEAAAAPDAESEPNAESEPDAATPPPSPSRAPDPDPDKTEAERAKLAEALERRAAERYERLGAEVARRLEQGGSDISLTRAEVAAAAGLADRDLDALESFGLVQGKSLGRDVVYDGDALLVARLAAAFLGHGLEVRHLRMFKVAAEREAGVFEQLVTPLVRQRNPESRQQAKAHLDELAQLGHDLHDALLRHALRGITGA